MSRQKGNSAQNNLGVGLACLLGSIALFNFSFSFALTNIFFAWFLLGVAIYGIVTTISSRLRFSAQAENIGIGAAVTVWIIGGVWAIWGRGLVGQIIGFCAFFLLIIGFAIAFSLITKFEKGNRTRILISSILCLMGSGFFAYYWTSARGIPIWGIVVLFLSATTVRQGLHNLFGTLMPNWSGSWLLYLFPEILTSAALLFMSQFDHLAPYFHITLAILAIGLFKVSSERNIPELEANERAKIGDDASVTAVSRFFQAIGQIYSGINFPVLGLVILLIEFDLPTRLVNENMQSAVFQASLASVAIIVSFVVLILQQVQKSEDAMSRQRYILRGLTGIAFIFIAVAVAAFIALSMTPSVISGSVLPNIDHDTLGEILANRDALFGLLLLSLSEWVFLAVPVSLIFIYGLVQDFVSRYPADHN